MAKAVGASRKIAAVNRQAGFACGRTLAAGLCMQLYEKVMMVVCPRALGRAHEGRIWFGRSKALRNLHPSKPFTSSIYIPWKNDSKAKFFNLEETCTHGTPSDSAQVGDVVCILLGGKFFNVLRPLCGTSVRNVDGGGMFVLGHEFDFVGEA